MDDVNNTKVYQQDSKSGARVVILRVVHYDIIGVTHTSFATLHYEKKIEPQLWEVLCAATLFSLCRVDAFAAQATASRPTSAQRLFHVAALKQLVLDRPKSRQQKSHDPHVVPEEGTHSSTLRAGHRDGSVISTLIILMSYCDPSKY